MSAQIYPAQVYHRVSRHPLNAVHNNAANPLPSPPIAVKPAQKAPASPPLIRQNSKIAPPSPPRIILDKSGTLQFHRIGFLGEGGFARVYEVKDIRGTRCACKVITKSSLKTKKAKTKLYAEIKIHKSLSHPNVVGFQECFEDEDNVYMTLELCHGGSLMDMLRRRRRFTEPETRFFMIQLIGACAYMHNHQVIHRDLKLGNIFLDSRMRVKVGDFGLAALIENPGERKKTVCGTPNYIAPEVLFDTSNGHSFEVDTWSIGVILYTLIIGRPPFQTKDVKGIYKRIRDNDYEFPADRLISEDARTLVRQILAPDPNLRPALQEIVAHEFFMQGIVPAAIPVSAHEYPPDFSYINRSASRENLKRLKRAALLDEDQLTTINVPQPPAAEAQVSENSELVSAKSYAASIAQQEREFQKAVQPGSPISALLSSARQPLMMSTTGTPGRRTGTTPKRDSTLIRKLQAVRDAKEREDAAREPQQRGGRITQLNKIAEEDEMDAHTLARQEEELMQKALESQKARIVVQMAPIDVEDARTAALEDIENRAPLPSRAMPPPPVPASRLATSSRTTALTTSHSTLPAPTKSTCQPFSQMSGFEAAAHVLQLAFEAKSSWRVFADPRADPSIPVPEERVFIVSWVDYCNKYGMGYALTDGSVGVHFNDSTSMVLSPDKCHFDYVTTRRQGTIYVRKSYTFDNYPQGEPKADGTKTENLKSKVYLLKHFERYIMDRLYGEYDYTFEDVTRERGMEWVQKYLRMKHVIVFKLSHDVIQFNFYDHSKLVLSSHGLMVTHIDKNYRMSKMTLREIMTLALDSDVDKTTQRLVDKLKYCKEVLTSIQSASVTGSPGPELQNAVANLDQFGAETASVASGSTRTRRP
ncbi:Pkinase-domain-containing protein [Fistulina hepatica ATCC 64428]|uniref:Serine/threonine-protein kinase n=1 Tax=Fistulina hepatica ATCC 64428 TaxID=1128425 RepID=A0A0D7AR29_9AGAR|nr:Pkinase-domain-containing protein [Fistulina hepatica ATCC 64428]